MPITFSSIKSIPIYTDYPDCIDYVEYADLHPTFLNLQTEIPWWATDSLNAGSCGLEMDGQTVDSLAAEYGSPLYLYSGKTIVSQVATMRSALQSTGLPFQIYYALKANRFAPVVSVIRNEGDLGLDVCSPCEVKTALNAGFRPEELSFTAGMLSNRDLDRLADYGVHLNIDSFSALRRYAERVPAGTKIGLRLDPAIQAGYGSDPKMAYGNSKFGFHPDDVEEALRQAQAAGLVVDTLHFHCGWGMQADALPLFDHTLQRVAEIANRIPSVETINVGGGLGGRFQSVDRPLPLDGWAETLRRHLYPLGVKIACEPGTFLVANAGILVAEVNTVERKGDITWVGVNAGFNVNLYPAHYSIPLEIVKVSDPYGPASHRYHIAGNINESGDVFARNYWLPKLEEGDLLALLPAGAYGSSMSSHHCMRGDFQEVLV